MFFTYLPTVHFYFVFTALALFLHVDSSLLTSSFSHRRGGLPGGRFRISLSPPSLSPLSLLTTLRVHPVVCEPGYMSGPAVLLLLVLRDHVLCSAPLPNYLAPDMITEHGYFHSPLCRNQVPFLLPGTLRFAYVKH